MTTFPDVGIYESQFDKCVKQRKGNIVSVFYLCNYYYSEFMSSGV